MINATLRERRIITVTALAGTAILLCLAPHAQASSTDFAADMQVAVTAPRANGIFSGVAQNEYRSAWDEFGMSALVSGELPASRISQIIANEVVHDAVNEIRYQQADLKYLNAIHSTPADVQSAEDADGNDLLPQDDIDPQPSMEANPDVNYLSTGDIQSLGLMDPAESSSTLMPIDSGSSSKPSIAPPEGGWSDDDVTIFQAIVDEPPADTSDSLQSAGAVPDMPPVNIIRSPTPADIPPAEIPSPEGEL